jgi:hypothetical protein
MRVSMRDLDNVLKGIIAWLPPANRVETLAVCTNIDWLNTPGLGRELDKMKHIALLAKLKLLRHMVSCTLTYLRYLEVSPPCGKHLLQHGALETARALDGHRDLRMVVHRDSL